MKKINWILVSIVLLAAVLRLWQLGNVPSSPDWDEAALGYNAYSIIQTGRDEYGKFMPVVLRSFDDYKPALYMYLSIPSILLFDLTTFAVRLPSAIFGILTVLATYYLLKELFVNSKSEIRNPKHIRDLSARQILNSNNQNSKHLMENGKWKMAIPVMAAALLAISPWHIQFSRIAFEANVGLAFNVFGALFFIKGLKNPWLLILSILSFVASIYVYQSEKVFTPLLVLLLIILYRKELLSVSKKHLVTTCIIGLIAILPMALYIVGDKNSLTRARGVSVFAEQTQILRNSQIKSFDDQNANNFFGEVIHNRRVVYATEIVSGYLSHYNLNWLFIKGDLLRHHAPDMALLYLWELPFILIGMYSLLFGNFPKKTKWLIFGWFLLAPVPASVTTGVPHAVRTLNFLPMYQIFTAIGLISAYALVIKSSSHQVIKRFIIACFLLLVSLNFAYYVNQYFVQQNYYHAMYWQYGYKELVDYLKEVDENYEKIVVSNIGTMDQSYMFFLFYTKYDPATFQKENANVSGGFAENGHKFAKFEFHSFDYEKEKSPRTLFVGSSEDFSKEYISIKKIYYPDGSLAYKVVEGTW